MFDHTFLLFARPSFIEGAARIFDFANVLGEYNVSNSPAQADMLAIAADWRAVGADMEATLARYQEEFEERMREIASEHERRMEQRALPLTTIASRE